MVLTLDQINAASQAEFVALLDGSYEHSPWIVERAWARRPFASLAALKRALVQVVAESGRDAQLALIRATLNWPARRWSASRSPPRARTSRARPG